MSTATTCPRHPRTETRLACVTCSTPICPKCAVEAPVGFKCPDCAEQPRAARGMGRPRQYAKALAFGIAASVGIGVALALFLESSRFLTLIATGFAGYGVGAAVLYGAEGNRGSRFRTLALVLAGLMVLGVWVLRFDTLIPGGLLVLSYAVAPYGAWLRFTR